MLCKTNLLLVKPKLEICDVVFFWRFLDLCTIFLCLVLVLLLLFLQLLRGLLGLPCKVFGADLSAQDGCLSPVVILHTECNLFQYKFSLFSSLHRPESLDLKLCEYICSTLEIALRFFDIRQDSCDTCPLNFDEYLRDMSWINERLKIELLPFPR
jgi:hypothetical protein